MRGGGADVAIDVVGYFKRRGNYGGTHVITGQYATDILLDQPIESGSVYFTFYQCGADCVTGPVRVS